MPGHWPEDVCGISDVPRGTRVAPHLRKRAWDDAPGPAARCALIVRALACDYDGTLASQDRIGPETRAALERAREAGLRLVLVTGRTFFDLTRVCDCFELFDAVVAENGAVLYWPRSQTLRDQAPAPSPRLLAELDRRSIAYQVGRVVVDTARTNEPGVREALEVLRQAIEGLIALRYGPDRVGA